MLLFYSHAQASSELFFMRQFRERFVERRLQTSEFFRQRLTLGTLRFMQDLQGVERLRQRKLFRLKKRDSLLHAIKRQR